MLSRGARVAGLILLALWLGLGLAACKLDGSSTPSSGTPATAAASPLASTQPSAQASGTAAEPSTQDVLAAEDPPARDLMGIARRMGRLAVQVPTPPAQATSHQIGDRLTFWVNDSRDNSYRQAWATLEAATPHLYLWVEDGFNVSAKDLQTSADAFEAHIYPTMHEIFGQEWSPGIDGDLHLFVFNGSVPGVGGYFWSADEYPVEVNPYSNQHETFFINLETERVGTPGYSALLAHEFQHMIHWYMDPNEDAWINEGLSELAIRVTGSPVSTLAAYLRLPDIQLNDWPEAVTETGPHYGGGYLLMEYLLSRFGNGFVRQVVSEPRNGVAGLDQVLEPYGLSFEQVFRDWTVANLLHDVGLGNGAYGYKTIQPSAPQMSEGVSSLPARVTGTVHPFGTDYISIPSAETMSVDFSGQPQVSLAGFTAQPDDHMWWSDRGDNCDMTLTHSVDLTGVSSATLHASLWYNIEKDWDFAAAEVSDDGGNSWVPLQGQYGRSLRADASSLGFGYTGNSGGGLEPSWIDETYSLDAFAGKNILLRFEYVTDDEVNLNGLWIRSLDIPEIGWHDDGESAAGWEAQGFVRVTSMVPQKYLLTAVIQGTTPEVVPIAVDEGGHGSLTLSAPEGAVLIVSAATPYTTLPASYTLIVESQAP